MYQVYNELVRPPSTGVVELRDVQEESTMVDVAVIGDYGVGKTALLHRLCCQQFLARTKPTRSVTSHTVQLPIEGEKTAKVRLLDIPGIERLRSEVVGTCKGAVLVYDITDTYSFVGLNEHLSEIKRAMPPDTQLSLAGTKADLDMLRKVSFQEAHTFAVGHYLSLFEVSSKTGKNVLELFQDLVSSILKKQSFESYSPVSLEVVDESIHGPGTSLMPCCWI